MRNIEIEQRFITHQQQVLINWLNTQTTWLSRNYYRDIYFQNPRKPFITTDENGIKDAHEWLRIRQCNDDLSKLCYKCWHRSLQNNMPLYADQIELNIDNPDNMKILLQRLNYHPIAEVYRWRTSWSYNKYIIVQDEVQDLGTFYEIEYVGSTQESRVAVELIHHLLYSIGIIDFKIIDKGYPWMYWNNNWREILGVK